MFQLRPLSPYQCTGRENDGAGLYFNRARYYSPSFQRFIAQDPIGFRGGDANLYGYALDSPLYLRDPLGLWSVTLSLFIDELGGEFSFGYSGGNFFGAWQGGAGIGGGITFDPWAGVPGGSTCHGYHSLPGTGFDPHIGLDVGPVGIDYNPEDDSLKPYFNPFPPYTVGVGGGYTAGGGVYVF